jgi:hypothetical protein
MSTAIEADVNNASPEQQDLIRELALFTGDLDRYRHWTGQLIYTPGIRHLAERAGAFWLIDLIASWQLDPKVRREPFQVWKLDVRLDHTAVAVATDGNAAILASQDIPFTDFPLPTIGVWLEEGTLLLPGEH